MIFKLCDRELTGLSKFKSLKLNFDVIGKKEEKSGLFFRVSFANKYIYIYIHHDPVMTLTHFMARSVYVAHDHNSRTSLLVQYISQISAERLQDHCFLAFFLSAVNMFGP